MFELVRQNPKATQRLFGILLALLVLGGFILCGVVRVSRSIEPPKPQTELVRPQDAEVEVVAKSLLAALQLRRCDSAYFFLSDSCRKTISESDFTERLTRWLGEDESSWELKYRRVGNFQINENEAEVLIQSNAPDTERRAWRWSFVKGVDGWKLEQSRGGPPLGRER